MAEDAPHDSGPDVDQFDAFAGLDIPLGIKPDHPNDPPKVNGHEHPRMNGHAHSEKPSAPKSDVPIVVNHQDPLNIARLFVGDNHSADGEPILRHHQASFMRWGGTHYAEIPEEQMRAQIYRFLEPALTEGKGGALLPFRPTAPKVNNVLDATRAVAQIEGVVSAPAWLTDHGPKPPREIIACANGLLHLPTGILMPHSPSFYCTSCLEYPFNPKAPVPTEWLKFLRSIWPDDPQAIETLQDMFGYYLGNETDQQKIPLLVGPLRSGKGTIARILTALLGQEAVATPSMNSLCSHFGGESLINKKLAIIADARLSGKSDSQVGAERLLSISGEDSQTIDRKHKPAWSGRLPTRFLIMSNELPQMGDASGALAGRFIIITMTVSFFGKEDHGLTDRLLLELPGILNWAIVGWRRLKERRRFIQPESSADAIQDLADLSSPISAFVRQRCEIKAGVKVTPDALFAEWLRWCTDQNRDHPGTKQSFGRMLTAAFPWAKAKQDRIGGDERARAYRGLGLKMEFVHKQAERAEGLDLDT